MNNLLLFREISGVSLKELVYFIHVSLQTYHCYEKDRITIPCEVKRLFAKFYDISEEEIFNSEECISNSSREKLSCLANLEEDQRKKKLSLNLSDGKLDELSFEQIEQIKYGESYCQNIKICLYEDALSELLFN